MQTSHTLITKAARAALGGVGRIHNIEVHRQARHFLHEQIQRGAVFQWRRPASAAAGAFRGLARGGGPAEVHFFGPLHAQPHGFHPEAAF